MSIESKLHIDDQKVKVLQFSFDYQQGADYNGRPSTKPVFKGLWLTIETQKNLKLEEWAIAVNQKKQLELHLSPTILGGKTRILYFFDAHLVKWDVNFTSIGSNPMTETLYITCAGVKDSESTVEYEAYWRETYFDNIPVTTINNEEQEAQEEEETGYQTAIALSL